MTKINGVELIQTSDIEGGYGKISGDLIKAGCDYFFKKRRLSSAPQFPDHPSRYPCGKKRPEGPPARIIRVKRTELSRSRKSAIS